MSQTRLHDLLENVFEDKTLMSTLFEHPDFSTYITKFQLNIPTQVFSQAFIHKSFSHEFGVSHQEQLEFLGDAVLQLILTDELYRRFPDVKEGHLSKLRSALVNEKSLALMARGLGLQDLILVGKGEYKKKLFLEDTVLGDTFEALLAQVYRYQGLDFTKKLFLEWLSEFIPEAFNENFLDSFDAKSKLQEKVLAKFKKLPRYTSEDRGNEFEIGLWVNEKLLASGVFPSKKTGEKELAREVLKKGLI